MALGIIIQARKGSSRLPGKMAMKFYNDQSLLEVILNNLKEVGKKKNVPVVLATTVNQKDDELVEIAEKCAVPVIRGSEDDVLQRFIDVAEAFQLDQIIRVCGDNPFLISEEIATLIDAFSADASVDYLSFKVNSKPSILTHFGLWTEAVRFETLCKVKEETDDSFYHEHVTNFIYSNPEKFNVKWILRNDVRFAKGNIRLTIDTAEDFSTISNIYGALMELGNSIEIKEVFNFIESKPELEDQMKEQILKNTK